MTLLNKPVFIGCASLLAYSVSAIALQSQQTTFAPSLGMFGTTGLIDMPSAESQPDAELTTLYRRFRFLRVEHLPFKLPRVCRAPFVIPS